MNLDFLVIGAEKGGTSFLHSILSSHPEVYMPDREISFFEDPDYLHLNPRHLDNLFKRVPERATRKGIRRAIYLGLPECPERIYNHSPDAKLIIALRNPIDRVISAYFHYMRLRLLPLMPLEEGLQKILNEEFRGTIYNKIAEGVIDFGFYHKHIQRYLQYINRDQILILLNQDIKNKKEGTFQKIYDFLDIDNSFTPASNIKTNIITDIRSNKGVYSLKRLKLFRYYTKIIYNIRYESPNWPYRSKTYPKKAKTSKAFFYSYNLADKLLFAKIFDNSKPKLTSTLSTKLFKLYEPDINQLGRLIDRSLENWKIN